MKKKSENIVGVVRVNNQKFFSKKNAPGGGKKSAAAPTQYWKILVAVWFDLYAELIPPAPCDEKAKPCFDTIETFQMKIILRELKKRAEEKNIEWTEDEAKKRWEAFLRKAFDDDFISKNFMLRIISNNKTKIFNNQITPKRNAGAKENIRSVGRTLDFDKP